MMSPKEIPYNGSLTWLKERTILWLVHGSRAYGTSRPDSDWDFKGICIPPSKYRNGFLHQFEQAAWSDPVDATIFDLRRFFSLAADCNPNIVELLYVDPSDILFCNGFGTDLLLLRDAFLSKKALYTFRGYAMAQLKRIRGHRRWLLTPPQKKPDRSDFKLPERTVIPADQLRAAQVAIESRMDSWEVDFGALDEAGKIHIQEQVAAFLLDLGIGVDEKFRRAGEALGYDSNFLELLDRERHYKTALTEWNQYQAWKADRNEARAALEAKYGYDTKHGMHLVRLMRMCREILAEGTVRTRRPDAAELLSIRDGAWSYDKILAWAEEQDTELVSLAEKSSLPKSPDRVALDEACQQMILDWESSPLYWRHDG